MKHIAYLAAAVVMLGAGAVSAADSKSSAARGKELFVRVGCRQCHGTVGQGSTAGPKLAPEPLPVEALTNFVHSTTGAMPAYKVEILSDANLADIHAYLASIPNPPSPDSIAILKGLKAGK